MLHMQSLVYNFRLASGPLQDHGSEFRRSALPYVRGLPLVAKYHNSAFFAVVQSQQRLLCLRSFSEARPRGFRLVYIYSL